MALLLAALLFVAKALLYLLAAVVVFILLLAVLPVKARVSGRFSLEGDFESFLDGDGAIALKDGAGGGRDDGAGDESDDDVAAVLEWDGRASVAVFGEALGADYARGEGLSLVVIGMRFRLPGGAGAAERGKTAPQRNLTGSRRSFRFRDAKAWLAPKVRKEALAAGRTLWKALRFRGRVDIELGLPDPSITGMATGAFLTWSGATRQRWLTFRPSFVKNVISMEAEGSARLIASQVAWIIGRFVLSREIRQLWRKSAGKSGETPVLGARVTG